MPFSSIIGHRHVIDLLRQAVARDRVPQSLLMAGPEGIGKRAVAVALAQAVNCPKRVGGSKAGTDACGACSTCLRIAKGQHSDVAFIDQGDAASLKIEVLRQRVLDVVGYRPFEASRRVYIIDPADAMTPQSQDALLKTLEEPPPSAILILVTAYPDTLLPTIQSRCRRLRFGPLAEADVAKVLVDRCKVDPARARILASASGGRVGAALAEDAGSLEEDRDAALGFVTAAAARGPAVATRLKAAAALAQHEPKRRSREALGTRLSIVQSLLRDMGAIHAGAAGQITNVDLEQPLTDLSRSYDAQRLSQAFALVGEAGALLERYASPKIIADWVAVAI
jgi:DNA polymerase-3 subunit delta'